MGHDKLGPGKLSSSHDAYDLASRDLRPGKQTLVSKYIEEGARCDSDPRGPDCKFDEKSRARLTGLFQQRVQKANANYNAALGMIEVEQLVRRGDDLPWVFGMLLDVAGAHLIATFASAVKRFRGIGLARLEEVALDAGVSGAFVGTSTTESMLRALTPQKIDGGVKLTLNAAKTTAASSLRTQPQQGSYLDSLRNQADVGFQALREETPRLANDVELLALFDAMSVEHHFMSDYKTALLQKLARFAKSGVYQIGEDTGPHETSGGEKYGHGNFHRKLVWIVYRSGRPRQLAYQRDDIAWVNDTPKLHGHVPKEFEQVAMDRHVLIWGVPPLDHYIDDVMKLDDAAIPKLSLEPSKPTNTASAPQPSAPVAPASSPIDVPDFFKNVDPSKLGPKP